MSEPGNSPTAEPRGPLVLALLVRGVVVVGLIVAYEALFVLKTAILGALLALVLGVVVGGYGSVE